jgi:hypothetical protein
MNTSITPHTALITHAKRILVDAQLASVSLLQRHLRVGYGVALSLMQELVRAEVILPASGNQGYRLDPRHFNRHRSRTIMDARALYIDKVRETALFFFELLEEGQDGHTQAIAVLKPGAVGNVVMRDKVLGEFYRARKLSLTDAALALHHWLAQQGKGLGNAPGIEAAVSTACAPYERPVGTVVDLTEKQARAFRRLARYYRLIYTHRLAISNHSRVVEYFVPEAWVPRGTSIARATGSVDGTHPEHVVPCAYIREACLTRYAEDWTEDDVAQMIQRWLVLVDITTDEAARLDNGADALKYVMPPGWDPIAGCIFQRLHQMKIDFTAPSGWLCQHS